MRLINAQEGTLARLWDGGVHFHSPVPLHRGNQRASRDTAAWKTLQAGRSVSEAGEPFGLCVPRGDQELSGQTRWYLASSVEVLLILRDVVKREEGVAVPSGPVADPVALPQQASLPDHVAALHRVLQVLLLLKNLSSENQSGAQLAS